MQPPHVDLLLTDDDAARPIRNLYPLYLHDIASYESRPPNRHGVLCDDEEVADWAQLLETNRAWWSRPDVLFPYLIRADARPAGFCLVASGPFVPTDGIDFTVYEFFVAHAWRGTGLATEAVRAACALHRGAWEVATWPTAARAIAFWRKTLPSCATSAVREIEEDHAFGRRVAFRFENVERGASAPDGED